MCHVHAGSLGAGVGRLAELAEKCASEPCGSALKSGWSDWDCPKHRFEP